MTGIGLNSCLGSLRESWRRLLAAESGIQFHQPFPELPPYPLGLIGAKPATFLSLVEDCAIAALADAGLQSPLPDCGVVVASSRSFQAQWEEWRRGEEKARENWLELLPHCGAIAAAGIVGSRGPVFAPMAACASGIWAIARAFELIQMGECDRVLAGAAEAPISPLTLAGFQKMGAMARTGCYPFDKHREGLVLGEGAALFLLESAEAAIARNAKIYGQVLGVGLTADGYHVSAPEMQSRSAAIAIKQCLERSGLQPAEIDYIHAHGTSTLLNDRNEAELIQALFSHPVAVSSTKGATGHTLGASGAIGMAFCLLALTEQILPPCVGLKTSEFNLNLVRESRKTCLKNLLCLSFGFGGQNAVLALSLPV
ncbi:beta-ketoacyl-ACP synthase [Oscillatoria sp. FACHB-1406]|uniref:beta-ketoacyl-ACP synthase n=1 Tax=Oscillatoria sp. FACHB-1406 TaxID=2692846 RepID=UPI00321F71C1